MKLKIRNAQTKVCCLTFDPCVPRLWWPQSWKVVTVRRPWRGWGFHLLEQHRWLKKLTDIVFIPRDGPPQTIDWMLFVHFQCI